MGTGLVLGGGGITGIAWEIGILHGLAERGLDLANADLVVGTSAGSVVGAQITSGTPLDELYRRQLAEPTGESAAKITKSTIARLALAALRSRDPQRQRKAIGKIALATETTPEAERREIIASRLPAHGWPRQKLLITAVDAASGDFEVFTSDSGVDLVDAVGASCAVPGVWPPVTIGDRRYVDGGVRSVANADLADGCEQIVLLAPITAGMGPIGGVHKQAGELRKRAKVVVVSPNAEARKAFGHNVLDPAKRAGAARAGYAQAAGEHAAVAEVWPS